MKRIMLVAITTVAIGSAGVVHATPSTNFWAPSTPYIQPYGVLHVTYDTYFQRAAAYPIDVGLEIGALKSKNVQLELGFDLTYSTYSPDGPVSAPLLLNAKVGGPEDAWFTGSPAWSAGIFALGFEENVTDYDVLHVMLGKTVPHVGSVSVGGYYGLNDHLFHAAAAAVHRSGMMAGWASSSIDVPKIDKIAFTWDVQTGKNVLGATGGGVYLYLTPAIDLLTGPVFFFDRDLQPGGASWMWSVQLDADIDLLKP